MSDLLNFIILISLLALAGILFRRDYKAGSWKKFILHAFSLIVCVFFFWGFYGFWTIASEPKGENYEAWSVALLYICMIFGMFANHVYRRLSREKASREKWDFGLFLAPLFVSPIIFIPLHNAISQTASESPGLISFLVAFQNGFLWKEYFDHKRKKTLEDDEYEI